MLARSRARLLTAPPVPNRSAVQQLGSEANGNSKQAPKRDQPSKLPNQQDGTSMWPPKRITARAPARFGAVENGYPGGESGGESGGFRGNPGESGGVFGESGVFRSTLTLLFVVWSHPENPTECLKYNIN